MNNAAVTAENYRPARGTRRNVAGLEALRRLGHETAFHGRPARVLSLADCRDCNAWLPAVTAAYTQGYEAGAAERAERLVRVATDAAEAAARRAR